MTPWPSMNKLITKPEYREDLYMKTTTTVLEALLLCVEGMEEDTLDSDFEQSRDDARKILSGPNPMLEALKACDAAFVSWQLGQIPGRPEDILALITQVRTAINNEEQAKRPQSDLMESK